MNPRQRPPPRFHVPGHFKRALVGAQGHVAPVSFATPPCAPDIPLFNDFPDDVAPFSPDQYGGPISLKPYIRVLAAAFYDSHVV